MWPRRDLDERGLVGADLFNAGLPLPCGLGMLPHPVPEPGGSLTSPAKFDREELRPLSVLENLPDEDLDWLCEHAERVVLAKGDRMFERGEPADSFWLVVRGVIEGFEEHGGQWLLVATTQAGEVTGMLPFSRMTHYPRNTVASEPSEVLRLDAALLPDLIYQSHEMGRRLVAQMSDRVRGDVRLEQQNEKMMALGKLSAGLAHELNNPAAAVRRAAARLEEHLGTLTALGAELVRHRPSDEGLRVLLELREVKSNGQHSARSQLERSEKEEALLDWLEERDVDEAWEIAATLASVGLAPAKLAALQDTLPEQALADALRWLSCGIDSDLIVQEIHGASTRISELVSSIKTYSHMDRSPAHAPTDVRIGIDNTLTMLGHKLKEKGVRIDRVYEHDLPSVPANEGELNQIWTNLIDNAIDAMEPGGLLTLRARRHEMWVEVAVVDNGAGIPAELHARIFEPFFTTKGVGEGTGLGLGIAERIARTHKGHIEVQSEPGETVMSVRLPLSGVDPLPG